MSYLFKNHKDRIVSVNANVKIINRRGRITVLCQSLDPPGGLFKTNVCLLINGVYTITPGLHF